jgi:hypothetical protein
LSRYSLNAVVGSSKTSSRLTHAPFLGGGNRLRARAERLPSGESREPRAKEGRSETSSTEATYESHVLKEV